MRKALLSGLAKLMGRKSEKPIPPPVRPVFATVYRPAKGWHFIYSERRQAQKRMKAALPNLRSGRQWTKYRKAAKRLFKQTNGERGFDFYSLPTYKVVP